MTADTVVLMPDFFACIYLLCDFRRSAVNLAHRINGKDYKNDKAEKASEYKQVFSGICTHLMSCRLVRHLSLRFLTRRKDSRQAGMTIQKAMSTYLMRLY